MLLMIWGVCLLIIFCVFFASGRFEMRSGAMHGGRTNRVFSRKDSPLIYWGTEFSILAAAVLLCAMGVFRSRDRNDGDDG
jgi:hypothetical protein